MDTVTPAPARPAAARAVAGRVLATALVAAAAVAALWLLGLPQPHQQVCPAVLPVPWWCSAEGVRAHGLRLTGLVLAVAGLAAVVAVRLGRRWPRAAWLPPLAVCLAGWGAYGATTP